VITIDTPPQLIGRRVGLDVAVLGVDEVEVDGDLGEQR
jgi:hypothetical protein